MKLLLRLLSLFALAIAIALGSQFTQGQVLIVWLPYRVELSLNLVLLLWLGSVLLTYGLVRVVVAALNLPKSVAVFREKQQREREQKVLQNLILFVLEGRYYQARQTLEGMPESSPFAGLSQLIGAYAAMRVRDYAAVEGYLSKLQGNKDFRIASTVLAAEAALNQQQPEIAWQILEQLKATVGLHGMALRLELKALQASKQWLRIPPVLKELHKREILDETQVDQLRWTVQAEALRGLAGDPSGLQEFWKAIAAQDRQQYRVVMAAVQSFVKAGLLAQAKTIIEKTLALTWHSDLLPCYAECSVHDYLTSIEHAERWLKMHPQDAKLLLILGQLCARQGLWGKAVQYLEASLSLEDTYSAHLALGEIHEHQGRSETASKHYVDALQLAVQQLQAISGDRRRLVW